jgi:hypothetical protein
VLQLKLLYNLKGLQDRKQLRQLVEVSRAVDHHTKDLAILSLGMAMLIYMQSFDTFQAPIRRRQFAVASDMCRIETAASDCGKRENEGEINHGLKICPTGLPTS